MAVSMNDPSSPSSKEKEHENNQQRRFAFGRRRIRSFSRRSRSTSSPDNASKHSATAASPVVVTTVQHPRSSLLRRKNNSNSTTTSNIPSSVPGPSSPPPYSISHKKCVSISPEYYDTSSSCTASITEKEELNSSLTSTSSSEEELQLSHNYHDNSSRYRDLPQQQHQQQQQQQLSPLHSRSIVPHQPSSSQDPMQIWYQSANNLIRSKEMAAFASSSKELVCTATGTAFKVAFLPLTLPIQVVTSTTSFVVDTCVHVTTSLVTPPPPSSTSASSCTLTAATSSSTSPSLPWFDLLHNASQIVPSVVRTTNQIKDDVGSTVLNLVGLGEGNNDKEVNNHNDEISTKENQETTTRKYRYGSYAEGDCSLEQTSSSFLDRLRLDYTEVVGEDMNANVNEKEDDCHVSTVPSGRSKSVNDLPMQTGMVEKSNTIVTVKQSISQFLLRVDDLGLFIPPQDSIENTNVLLYFIDLSSLASAEDTTTTMTTNIDSHKILGQTFDSLVSHALSLFSNNPECQLNCSSNNHNNNNNFTKIEWKPEGSTHRILKKIQKMKSKHQECNQLLENEILIWSGKFKTCSSNQKQPHHYGHDTPLFMSRGIVPMSPRNFVRLLWDSNRTSEYNKYNLGRSDVLVVQDDSQVLSTTSSYLNTQGSKIIKSETKVPFTGMSITMSALMHVRPLEDGDGYVIVTRSLSSGKAGCHTDMDSSQVEKNPKSEILWGVNVLRTVRDSPHQTDLISVSQVGSSIVPGFLSKKIGIMACEDFFSEVRGKQFFN